MTQHIKITAAPGTWVVRVGGAVIGESTAALELTEGSYAPVIYFPREDLAMAFLEASDHSTTCPHKGAASYFSVVAKSKTYENAGWSYETPAAGAEAIAGHVAFYEQDGITIEQI